MKPHQDLKTVAHEAHIAVRALIVGMDDGLPKSALVQLADNLSNALAAQPPALIPTRGADLKRPEDALHILDRIADGDGNASYLKPLGAAKISAYVESLERALTQPVASDAVREALKVCIAALENASPHVGYLAAGANRTRAVVDHALNVGRDALTPQK